jgi:hypothetical protein
MGLIQAEGWTTWHRPFDKFERAVNKMRNTKLCWKGWIKERGGIKHRLPAWVAFLRPHQVFFSQTSLGKVTLPRIKSAGEDC